MQLAAPWSVYGLGVEGRPIVEWFLVFSRRRASPRRCPPPGEAVLLSADDLCRAVRLLNANGFGLRRQKGSKRFYSKVGFPGLIQVDFHGKKEVPTGTLHKILKDAGIQK